MRSQLYKELSAVLDIIRGKWENKFFGPEICPLLFIISHLKAFCSLWQKRLF